MIDIPKYDMYKYDTDLGQIYSIKNNKYLKNTLTNSGYYLVSLYKNGKVKKYYIHRLCYMCNNPTEDISLFAIDHIDNDRTNNKIENLRKCCISDNNSNRLKPKHNTTGYKNIHIHQNGYYRFQLTKNKIRYSKCFKNLQDAVEYRDIKVKEINGEFSNLG